jgi:hypothetical protein
MVRRERSQSCPSGNPSHFDGTPATMPWSPPDALLEADRWLARCGWPWIDGSSASGNL